jgi:hypothetical protein
MKSSLAIVTLFVLALAVGRVAATPVQSAETGSDTYFWHGELVALDQTAKTITVKSMVVGSALEELGHFKAGDRVLLSWSGLDKYANAVNHVARYDATRKSDERFAFPAEFVSFDTTQKDVTFKAQIPAESISKLQSLKPGQWVTATSPHGKAGETQPIVAIRGYNEPANNS